MTGADLIAAERWRQIEEEGWTPEHDDEHTHGELALAAICYIADVMGFKASNGTELNIKDPDDILRTTWPWAEEWWRPSGDRVRNLVKAGALIAAEIDRLQREKGS